jgi:hypothetical protein
MVIKKIVKQVMSLINKTNPKSVSEKEADFFLEKQEIELILLIIKDGSFRGEQLENLYNTVYKLQQQYLQINN